MSESQHGSEICDVFSAKYYIFPGVSHVQNWLTDNDLTDRWSAGYLQESRIVASNVCLQALSPPFLPFLCYFFPKREPVSQATYSVITDAFDKHLRIKINDKNFEWRFDDLLIIFKF